MIRTQELKVTQDIPLTDIMLEKNKTIEIYVENNSEINDRRYMKIVNIEGELVIFLEDAKDLTIKEWEGNLKYKKTIREIEDRLDGE